jgi:DNA repair protein RecO (recombination protein O)
MTHKTKGIVLRTLKYGETSLVVTVFTELFGVQTYMVNGVRSSKKNTAKANYFQPAAILDMVVYHHEQKTMQRIKEFKWDHLYQHVFSDVIKNNIALYMVELLYKCLKQPEQHAALFYFCEDVLFQLDVAPNSVVANLPLFFALHLPHFFGFKINDNYDKSHTVLDLLEGNYVEEQPLHSNFIDGEYAEITSQLLKVMHPKELEEFKLQGNIRNKLLMLYHHYYAIHVHDFGQMKTLAVLHEVLNN